MDAPSSPADTRSPLDARGVNSAAFSAMARVNEDRANTDTTPAPPLASDENYVAPGVTRSRGPGVAASLPSGSPSGGAEEPSLRSPAAPWTDARKSPRVVDDGRPERSEPPPQGPPSPRGAGAGASARPHHTRRGGVHPAGARVPPGLGAFRTTWTLVGAGVVAALVAFVWWHEERDGGSAFIYLVKVFSR